MCVNLWLLLLLFCAFSSHFLLLGDDAGDADQFVAFLDVDADDAAFAFRIPDIGEYR
jgi:hypothetical protein